MPAIELSVVVPVFRNASQLAELAKRLERALVGRRYELIFVDDASPDRAGEKIVRLGERDARIGGIALARNVGQNAAIVAGLARARGDVVAVMDGDLQDPPEALPPLLDALCASSTDVVFAARRGHYQGLLRLVSGRLLKLTLWGLTRRKVPPTAGLCLVMRRAVAERVVASATDDPYVLVLVARAARSVATVPVERGHTRTSSYTTAMRWRLARRALTTAVRR
jgi:glycosyltransferase involved in cell wall biosynthesis